MRGRADLGADGRADGRVAVRPAVLGGRSVAQCGICDCVEPAELCDVDHIIPLAAGGPNEPWNLWPLCVRDHRRKTLWEKPWAAAAAAVAPERLCWGCGAVVSRYFAVRRLWCSACAARPDRLTLHKKRVLQDLS